MSDRRERARELAKTMRCNCDLDNWEPERTTGHSWVCRIHKVVMSEPPPAFLASRAERRLGPSGFDRGERARIERLALNLRAYAYAMGAPRTDTDEEVALGAARLILPALEKAR